MQTSNELAMLSVGRQPAYPIVLEKLHFMENCIEDLHDVIRRLVGCHSWTRVLVPNTVYYQDKLFQKMVKIIKSLEILLHEVHKTKGWKFVEEPLWVTWSLEKFGALFIPYRCSVLLGI